MRNRMRPAAIAAMALCLCLLSGCGSKVKDYSLSGPNGSEVSLSIDTTGGTKVSTSDGSITIDLPAGRIEGSLVSASTVDSMVSGHYNDATFAEMTINGGTGFAYDESAVSHVHVIPVDDNTYLVLLSESADYIFDLESLMTITSVTAGTADGNGFADSVSQFGAGSDADQHDPGVIGDGGVSGQDAGLMDPFAG